MKLRTKILVMLGILLSLMVVIMYILPAYIVRKDVYKAANEIHELLMEDQRQLLNSQKIWTATAYEKNTQNISALLYMLYEMKNLSTALIFDAKNSNSKVWQKLLEIASLDPDVGFVQAHSPAKNESAALTTSEAHLYPISTLKRQNEIIAFHIEGVDNNKFVGIRLPNELQVDTGYEYFAVANVKNVPKEVLEIHTEITKELEELEKKRSAKAITLQELRGFTYPQAPGSKIGFLWALKMHMIRLLTPLYINGLTFADSTSLITPEGLIRVDSSQTGLAILSKEIFKKEPLFNDSLFYEQHPPNYGPSLSSATAVFVEANKNPFIGQVLKLDSTYVSLGFSLQTFAKDLALASNRIILMQVNNNYWLGFDGNGNRIREEFLGDFVKQGLKEEKGILNVKNQDFFFILFSSFNNGSVKLYQIHPTGGEKTILGTLFRLENQLTGRISLQLALISLGTLLLVLIFIGRIGLHVIYPVTKLAQATEDVARGRYDEVKLPEMGKSQDEIAILTRSFGEMVRGLQEREKIRGVLDKVVSKDVADEILRTQIHLGGEDRVVTMLFSDIRDFSSLTENLSPQETIHILNACMTKISRVIEGEGGVIDKYVGDEIMAIFGAPTRHPDHALRAVSSGILIVETLKKWNVQRQQNNQPPIEMGIGIHTGLVVAGNMGAEDRLNYTVLGSNVNLAARLCEVATRNQLIISENTLKEPNIEESFYVKALPPISLKGFSEPVPIYEVIGFKWEES